MTPSPGRIPRSGLLLAALLAALPLLPALGAGRTLWYRDAGQHHLPNRALAARMIQEGSLPLWNPYRGNGQPFMANPNSLVLRPTTPLFLLFAPERARVPFALSVILLAALAGAGAFALLSDCGRGPAAALVGAAAFGLSGAFQSLGQLVNLLEGAAWIPICLFLLNRAFLWDARVWGSLAGLALAMVISTGEPVIGVLTLAASPALPGFWSARAGRILRAAAIAGTVALLVASAQLLPLVELVRASARSAPLPPGTAMKWSIPPAALLQTALPSLWGDPTRAGPAAYWGSGLFETSLPFLPSLHLGLPTLILAALGAVKGGASRFAAAVAALFGAAMALGRHVPILPALAQAVPGVGQSRYPAKWFLLASLGAAFLAAAGFDDLFGRDARGPGARRASRWIVPALAMGAPAGLALWILRPHSAIPLLRGLLGIPDRFTDAALASGALPAIGRSAFLACLAALTLALAALARGGSAAFLPALVRGSAARWSPHVAAALCVAVLLWGAWGLNPAAPREVVFAPSPLLDSLPQEQRGDRRLYGAPRPPGFGYRTPSSGEASEAGLPPDSLAWGMRWDARTLRFSSPYLHGVRSSWDQAGESLLGLEPAASTARRIAEGLPAESTLRLLRAASVGWVLTYGDPPVAGLEWIAGLPGESNFPARLFALGDALPRVMILQEARSVATAEEALAAIEQGRVDPARTLLLEGDAPRGEPAADLDGVQDRPPIVDSRDADIPPSREASPAGREPQGSARVAEETPAGDRVLATAPRIDRGPRTSAGLPATGEPPAAPAGSARIVSETPVSVVVRVSAEREGWLLMTDSWAPGWQVEIDGVARYLHRANGAFRAVPVPPGDHEATFTYRPGSVMAGAGASVLGLLVAAVLLLAPLRRRAGRGSP